MTHAEAIATIHRRAAFARMEAFKHIQFVLAKQGLRVPRGTETLRFVGSQPQTRAMLVERGLTVSLAAPNTWAVAAVLERCWLAKHARE